MSKGIKLKECYHSLNETNIKTSQVKSSDREYLECPECHAKMTYTIEHSRKIGSGSEIKIPTYFRLYPKKEHDKDCPNSIIGAITEILKKSKALNNGQEVFTLDSKGKFRISIKQVKDDIGDEKPCKKSNSKETTKIGRRPITGEQVALPYLTTAAALAKLYFSLDEQERTEFRKYVEIVMEGRTLRWSSFFYEKLEDLAMKTNVPKHPIAVFVCPRDEPKFKRTTYEIQCYKAEIDNPIIIPRIYTPDKKIADAISEEAEILAIGTPYKTTNGKYVNLGLYINNKAQYTSTIDY
ncbi:hypothetical protein [Marinifilum fragile]|uniref:hypothetical protein n=1 Tax=Marinifilum fragile TaxID=570161 RepID=UPI002AA7B432|nr:hypothetical protein [Marinifilum fragile]